ncbi:hypothetical protein [Streptomyces sp. V3I7]|uniref:hypothetical protein n=1 Tax=Streptomyces sp. V3I7 TaxID=3042278 RepID=UPI0027D8B8BC|nr:hypothetical protein [Streptomyces sp. V3I7]
MLVAPDRATAEGEAIRLARQLDALQEDTGEWPGANTVDILATWLGRFSFADARPLPTQAVGRTWVLRRWDRHTEEVTHWSDQASALARLAQHARSSWDNLAGDDDVPLVPPGNDQAVADVYFGHRDDEGYSLYAAEISRVVRAQPELGRWDADACAKANSAAVFHPQERPDDEGLPCIEVAGVLVFAYLDADSRTLRVSVHLDSTDKELLRPDGSVPLRVEVEDDTVFPPPQAGQGAPAPRTRGRTLLGWLAGRAGRRGGTSRSKGVDPPNNVLVFAFRRCSHGPVRHASVRHRHR